MLTGQFKVSLDIDPFYKSPHYHSGRRPVIAAVFSNSATSSTHFKPCFPTFTPVSMMILTALEV